MTRVGCKGSIPALSFHRKFMESWAGKPFESYDRRLSVDDGDTSEKTFELHDLLFDHRVVLSLGRLFHRGSNLGNPIESVAASITFQAMA